MFNAEISTMLAALGLTNLLGMPKMSEKDLMLQRRGLIRHGSQVGKLRGNLNKATLHR